MKKFISLTGVGMLLIAQCNMATAKEIDQSVIEDTVHQVGKLMENNYVSAEQGKQTAELLINKLGEGAFNNITDSKVLADTITDTLREVTGDKHLRVRAARSGGKHHTEEDLINEQLDRQERDRYRNNGVHQVRKLEGNVGYLELTGFQHLSNAKAPIDAAMSLLASSDALIIDLRKNGGGSPSTVQYLCSYFFDEKLLLNSLYWREGDVTDEFWTLESVNGQKLPEIPLYVLTSRRTFSGAEEFSYNMKTRERAVLIGETTGGGANPGGMFRVNDHFGVFIATGKAINPVTGTNWEGTGVVPDISVSKDEAFDKAVALASEQASIVREKRRTVFKAAMTEMTRMLDNVGEKVSVESLKAHQSTFFSQMTAFARTLSLSEGQINGMGYDYLMQKQQPATALLIMQFNVHLHPNSANALDSLGEVWLKLDRPKEAKANFLAGLSLVGEDNHRLRDILQKNLQKADDKLNAT
ncbi:hypothetical protein DRW07_01410 [Alteromonas sediminis]|uniref:Tail specific protease domain-containing protein n=1 Tax=Alteromonas sediminis TaxID=2259342 RepID=A0A3N5ZDF2_9ALTE|nr:S41 family peptidase [Alteromonas sediminis]RPJ68098.1 hypothetical protein DRW07_01410 [Alteromonas sediminis]